ncbi:MAG: hypothetical protein IKM69_03910 [Alistipes sp.]|nr:hypothetical protein [Alistipes sp.]
MNSMHDEFNPLSEEELEQRQADEKLERLIRSQIRRVQSGEADEQMRQEAEEEREQEQEQMREEARKRLKRSRLFWQLFSGNILVNRNVAENYRYFIAIAITSFVSIAVLFMALYAEDRFSKVEREVQLLRERSIRLQEQLFSRTTHAAIAKEVEERGLGLQEPRKSREVVED